MESSTAHFLIIPKSNIAEGDIALVSYLLIFQALLSIVHDSQY